jgi:hypothetical protein
MKLELQTKQKGMVSIVRNFILNEETSKILYDKLEDNCEKNFEMTITLGQETQMIVMAEIE